MRSSLGATPIVGLAAVLAVAIAGGTAAQSPSPEVGEAGAVDPVTATAPQLRWDRVDGLPEVTEYSPISSLTAHANGSMLGAGDWGENGEWKPAVWHSPDGETWKRIQLRGADRTVDAAPFGDGFAVTGSSYDYGKQRGDGYVWLSSDGVAWSEPTKLPNVVPSSIHATPEGLAIIGYERGKQKDILGVWHSPDGIDWERSVVHKGIGPAPGAFAISDGVWLLFGTALDGRSPGRKDHLWRSPDGRQWEEVKLPIRPKDWKYATLRDLAPADAGFLATYAHMNDKPASAAGSIWLTPDGQTWEKVHAADVFVTELEAIGDGFVAFTEPLEKKQGKFRKNDGTVLVSADGRDWQPLANDAFVDTQVHAAAATVEGNLVAVGGDTPDRTTNVMWFGEVVSEPSA